MDDRDHETFLFEVEDQPAWPTVILFALALAILLVAFVWFVTRIDPLLSDFFPSQAATSEIATPTVVEPE